MNLSVRRVISSGFLFWVALGVVAVLFLYPIRKKLKLGIDLVGGTYITLDVKVEKAIEYELRQKLQRIPDFLKNEEDVVTLLQVFSDYINNAYRNMSTVKKFNFKLFSLEGNVVAYTKKLQELADLFTLASVKDSPILFISKPDPSGTNNFSQDPFTQTVDSSMSTVGGFAPRLVQFDISDVSKVRSRKIKDLGSLTYHEIFCSQTDKR